METGVFLMKILSDTIASWHLRQKFRKYFRENTFGSLESKSGEGSGLFQTRIIRRELPKLLRNLHVKTIIDSPCGDLNWIKKIDFNNMKYIGIDIVSEIIALNKRNHTNQEKEFYCLDIINDKLPKADLILCRDCLVHLNFQQGMRAIRNFKKSGSKYLFITTFTNRPANDELIGNEVWRPLNLQLFPFNFPKPIKLINEKCTEGNNQFADKCLGLWLLNDLSL